MESNVVGWFEIPVEDMERAMKFYTDVFGFEMKRQQMGEFDMGWFPFNHEGIGAPGSLVKYEGFYKPSTDGTLIYFAAPSGDLNNEMAKVEPAGGKVLMEKKQISPEHGYMSVFQDTEGNRVAMHSQG